MIPILRSPSPALNRQAATFAAVGGLCFFISLLIQWCCTTLLDLHYLTGYLLAVVVTTVLNWWLNRRHTFGSSDSRISQEVLRHQGVSLLHLMLSGTIYVVLVSGFGLHYLIALILISPTMLMINFFLQRRIVFQRRGDR